MSRSKFKRCNLFSLTQEMVKAHDGDGEVAFARIAKRESLDGECNFIDFTRVPPGATIGRHTHGPHDEEFYLVLSGTGQMTVDGDSFPVSAGELIRNSPGGTHELANTGAGELQLFVFEVQVR